MTSKLLFGTLLLITSLVSLILALSSINSGKLGLKSSYVYRKDQPKYFISVILVVILSSILSLLYSGIALAEVTCQCEIIDHGMLNEKIGLIFLMVPCCLNVIYLFTRRFTLMLE
jgi:hypothetical protein